jgi:hypothetical protein
MKQRMALIALLVLAAVLAVACGGQQSPRVGGTRTQPPTRQTPHPPTHQEEARVPAFQDAKSTLSLPPTLAPEQFVGLTRDAYRVAREIPETIAQLPCYCHCDQSIGHKSLHSCFVDNHASQCAVCVNEALIAYNMKKSGMTPAQIRERIIEQYSREQ